MLRYEIRCALPDHTSKDKGATHWVTVDWAFTQKEADEKRDLWIKKGEVRIFDTERQKKKSDDRPRRRRDRDDEYDY